MVIASINQRDVSGCVPQSFGGCQSAKTSAYDDDSGLGHIFSDSFRLLSSISRSALLILVFVWGPRCMRARDPFSRQGDRFNPPPSLSSRHMPGISDGI